MLFRSKTLRLVIYAIGSPELTPISKNQRSLFRSLASFPSIYLIFSFRSPHVSTLHSSSPLVTLHFVNWVPFQTFSRSVSHAFQEIVSITETDHAFPPLASFSIPTSGIALEEAHHQINISPYPRPANVIIVNRVSSLTRRIAPAKHPRTHRVTDHASLYPTNSHQQEISSPSPLRHQASGTSSDLYFKPHPLKTRHMVYTLV